MRGRPVILIVLAILLGGIALPAVDSLPLGLEAGPTGRTNYLSTYPTRDLAGNVVGSQQWRIVLDTGNCCENLVATTPDGRILDFGGDHILIGTDDGRTWHEVDPVMQLSGEGSIAYAPNGDLLGVVWDPYSGDRLTALKLPAGETRWQMAPVALHRPFYDRPWVAIAPGPFEVAGVTYPYATLLYSNYQVGYATDGMLVSFDGLTYVPSARASLGGTIVTLTQSAKPWADWVQPTGQARLTPLPDGGIVATMGCPWQRLGMDLLWDCILPRGPVAQLPAIARFDSLGRLHVLNVDAGEDVLHYRVSSNGGVTWRTTTLPRFGDVVALKDADFVVNGALDTALVALRYRTGGNDHFAVLRLAGLSGATPAIERLDVGLGDRSFGSDASSLGPRFDFVSIAMLPDGRAVTSFADSAHHPPAIAIELT